MSTIQIKRGLQSAQASPYVLGHIMIGTGFSVGSDGTMTLTAVDGGTF